MVAKKKTGFDLEKSLTELEQLIEKMEAGNLSLDQSLELFERGVVLTKDCQKTLRHAEQKVQQLLGDGKLVKYPSQDESA